LRSKFSPPRPLGAARPPPMLSPPSSASVVRPVAGGGQCPQSCEGVCWEPEAGPSRTHWKFVGEGQGAYEKLPQYNFVGKGNGTYQQASVREQIPTSCPPEMTGYAQKVVPFAIGLGVVLVIFFGGSLLATHSQASSEAVTSSSSNSVVNSGSGIVAGAGLDCQGESDATWSAEQRQRCCEELGVGCETTTEPFDCMAGYHIWEQAWSAGHKAWCCDHYRRGCEVTTTAVPFNCEEGYPEHVDSGWSKTKKAWCCEHEHVACPEDLALSHMEVAATAASPTTTTEFHDCQQDFASWSVSWSRHKKAWCCEHQNAGCPTAAPDSTPPPPPPSATAPKFAPPPVPTPMPPASPAPMPKPVPVPSPMPLSKPATAPAPPPMPPAPPRPALSHEGCSDGLAGSWPQEKRSWCCEHEHICFGVAQAAPVLAPKVPQGPKALASAAGEGGCEQMCNFGGNAATCTNRINWLVTHSLRASDNACSVAVERVLAQCPMCHGCSAAGAQCQAAEPYDCHAPQTGLVWSPSKQDWCCEHQGVGCKTPAKKDFDCAAGWNNWQKGWAIKKKAWCCIHAGKACPPAKTMARLPFASMTYDCNEDYATWTKDWSVGKKAWCCINEKRGCDQ